MEYNEGKTVINIEISQMDRDGPPAITICPPALDIVKMATINNKYKKLRQQFVQEFNNSMGGHFHLKYQQIVHDDINQGLLSLADVFNNYTYDYEEELRMGKIKFIAEMGGDNSDGSFKVGFALVFFKN